MSEVYALLRKIDKQTEQTDWGNISIRMGLPRQTLIKNFCTPLNLNRSQFIKGCISYVVIHLKGLNEDEFMKEIQIFERLARDKG